VEPTFTKPNFTSSCLFSRFSHVTSLYPKNEQIDNLVDLQDGAAIDDSIDADARAQRRQKSPRFSTPIAARVTRTHFEPIAMQWTQMRGFDPASAGIDHKQYPSSAAILVRSVVVSTALMLRVWNVPSGICHGHWSRQLSGSSE
jgi:hypothetical protein